MEQGGAQLGRRVLAATGILAFVLGSVHAFSVFLEPLEQAFGASRARVSLTYSLALVSLTLAVTFGHRLYGLLPAWGMAMIVGTGAAAGAGLAGWGSSLVVVWLGYSLIFGALNGLGYGFALQLAAQANPRRTGLAMGVVTAAYGCGAMLFPLAFAAGLSAGGFSGAMGLLAVALLLSAVLATAILFPTGVAFKPAPRRFGGPLSDAGLVVLLWAGYGTAVIAGLMAIGHSTGIAREAGLPEELVLAAPVAVALCSMTGGLAGGWSADRLPPMRLLVPLPCLSALSLAGLPMTGASVALPFLGLIGLMYGAIIAVYPAVIAARFGVGEGARIYGIVFTAWGLAGLAGPWLAGRIFDQSGGYAWALAVAAVVSVASTLVTWRAGAQMGASGAGSGST